MSTVAVATALATTKKAPKGNSMIALILVFLGCIFLMGLSSCCCIKSPKGDRCSICQKFVKGDHPDSEWCPGHPAIPGIPGPPQPIEVDAEDNATIRNRENASSPIYAESLPVPPPAYNQEDRGPGNWTIETASVTTGTVEVSRLSLERDYAAQVEWEEDEEAPLERPRWFHFEGKHSG